MKNGKEQTFTLDETIYGVNEIEKIIPKEGTYKIYKDRKGNSYCNLSSGFDTETSSFTQQKIPYGTLYAWVMGINGKCVIGRTYEEMIYCFQEIQRLMKLDLHHRLVCYIHNIAFDYQFIRKWIHWENVFATDTRTPLYALSEYGIEFRCSLKLSGYRLEYLGENMLFKYKVKKMVGDLDYDLIRTTQTPLTEKEKGYILHDCLVVMAYIQEKMEENGSILKLPLTKTGFVRKLCRKNCLYGGEKGSHHGNNRRWKNFRYLMNCMKVTSLPEYKQWKRAFCGGFTHANSNYVGLKMKNVTSYDFTSSYPSVMIAEKYPIGSGELIPIESKEHFERMNKLYCTIFDITFYDLEPKVHFEHYLSSSKCNYEKPFIIDNGRVVKAKKLWTTITNVDFEIIKKYYSWSHMIIRNFRRYVKGYLPTDFVMTILELYHNKTTLKGVEGKEIEYMNSKEQLNSMYGMSVTDIIQNNIELIEGELTQKAVDPLETLNRYNESKNRFLFYAWGIFVTAYARRNLHSGILEFKDDYIYSDTDSIKVLNAENHQNYIDSYNKRIGEKMMKACEHHGIDPALTYPKTIKGKEKPLGVWDFEETMSKFKTLGAKRYLFEYNGELHLTVSGVAKESGENYLNFKYKDPFKAFTDGLVFPSAYEVEKDGKKVKKSATGKLTHTYIDEEQEGIVKDYLGNWNHFKDKSSVNLAPCDYSLSMSQEFIDYLCGFREMEGVFYHGRK